MTIRTTANQLTRRLHRGRPDAGFGTVEWVLISFFVAGMAIVIGVLLFNAVSDKGEEVEDCIAGAVGCES